MKGVRILVPDTAATLRRYGVCQGRDKPHRGAWWQLVSSFDSQPAALRAFEALDQRKGRAWVDLEHDDIQPINLHGAPLVPAETLP